MTVLTFATRGAAEFRVQEEISLNPAMSFELRAMHSRDLVPVGGVLYEAFEGHNASVNVAIEVDFPTVEAAISAVETRMTDELSEGVVAVDSENTVVGAGFVRYGGEVHYLLLIAVLPQSASRGVGKAIILELMNKSREANAAASIRLVQAASNTRSFSLYAKLGFRPVEFWSNFSGRVGRKHAEASAASLGVCLADYEVRQMDHSDLVCCSKLFKGILGYDRESLIRERMLQGRVQVVIKDGTLLGFTTGFSRSGFLVAADEEAAIALYAAGDDLSIYILGQRYPRILQWAFRAGTKLMRHGSVMVVGKFVAPQGNMVFSGNME